MLHQDKPLAYNPLTMKQFLAEKRITVLEQPSDLLPLSRAGLTPFDPFFFRVGREVTLTEMIYFVLKSCI